MRSNFARATALGRKFPELALSLLRHNGTHADGFGESNAQAAGVGDDICGHIDAGAIRTPSGSDFC